MAWSQPQFHRSRKSSLGALVVALALVGCQPAAFNATAPTPPATTASAKPSTPVALVNFAVRGLATVQGAPLAGATVQAFDALTNKAVGIVAAGGGNIVASGGGNHRVLLQSTTTDAAGTLNFQVAGVKKTQLVRLVVRGLRNGKPVTVTRLVSASQLEAKKPGSYVLAQANTGTDMNEATTTHERQVSQQLAEKFANNNELGDSTLPDSFLDQIDAALDRVEAAFVANPGLADQVLALLESLTDAGTSTTFAAGILENLTGLESIFSDLELAVANAELVSDEDLTAGGPTGGEGDGDGTPGAGEGTAGGGEGTPGNGTELPGTDTETETGTETTTNGDGNQPEEEANVVCGGDPVPALGSTNFNPDVELSYSGSLTISVDEQSEQGDMRLIVARIPKDSGTTFTAPGAGVNLLSSGTTTSAGNGTQPLTIRDTNKTTDDTNTGLAVNNQMGDINIPGSSALYTGVLETATNRVATVQVFEDSNFYFVAFTYDDELSSLDATGGNTTMTINPSFFSKTASNVQAYIYLTNEESDAVTRCDLF